MEEGEGRRGNISKNPQLPPDGHCPRRGAALAGGGAGEEKSKGRCEDLPAD